MIHIYYCENCKTEWEENIQDGIKSITFKAINGPFMNKTVTYSVGVIPNMITVCPNCATQSQNERIQRQSV